MKRKTKKKGQEESTQPQQLPAPDSVSTVGGGQEESVETLNAQVKTLQDQLAGVVATAASNEKIWRHFAEIERILFRARDLDQLAYELLAEIRDRFQPNHAVLLLCHPDILERFFPDMTPENGPVGEGTWVFPVSLESAKSLFGESPRPIVMRPDTVQAILDVLPPGAGSARSGVLIPLCIHQVLFGALFLGSLDARHYQPQDSTDLLEQLAIKIALCMENCLTYERLKDFAIEDRLTGLISYFQIHTLLEREFRKARRTGAPLSVLIIAPHFYHEANGHIEIGSRVLRHVADQLSEILPEGESFLGRYGGDEFLLVLPNVQDEEAREVVPYLTQMIRKKPFRYENTAILIQTLISVGSLEPHMLRSQELLDAALSELCNLKMSGRDFQKPGDRIAS
jgi:diguanylate cyclase (GGDEF)-like protein